MTSKLTRERLAKIAAGRVDARRCNDDEIAMAITLLAAMGSEPVIIVGDDSGDALSYRRLLQSFAPGTKLYRHAQPAPAVPDEMPCGGAADDYHDGYQDGWNACRAAMLQAEPVTTANKLGNSPVIPDGYVMVPKEATLDMLKAGAKQEMKGEAFQYVWQAMLAAAPQEVSDA